jgi:hypothetical protein
MRWFFPWENNVNRKLLTMLALAGLAALLVVLFLVWCPPDACRALNIQTHTISELDEYREFLADEAAFHALHRARAVRLDCSALRDDVVTTLENGRLTLGISEPNGAQGNSAQVGPVKAWHQGRLLHLGNGTFENREESEAWAVSVRESVAERQGHELAFLPRLFGGLILHVHNKETPIVLFSRNPCI